MKNLLKLFLFTSSLCTFLLFSSCSSAASSSGSESGLTVSFNMPSSSSRSARAITSGAEVKLKMIGTYTSELITSTIGSNGTCSVTFHDVPVGSVVTVVATITDTANNNQGYIGASEKITVTKACTAEINMVNAGYINVSGAGVASLTGSGLSTLPSGFTYTWGTPSSDITFSGSGYSVNYTYSGSTSISDEITCIVSYKGTNLLKRSGYFTFG